jgi:hypothetical protein
MLQKDTKTDNQNPYIEGQTTQCPKDRRTDNTMSKRQKDRQHNVQKTEGQTTQCPKEKVKYIVCFDDTDH